jgi:hypothetical protein
MATAVDVPTACAACAYLASLPMAFPIVRLHQLRARRFAVHHPCPHALTSEVDVPTLTR